MLRAMAMHSVVTAVMTVMTVTTMRLCLLTVDKLSIEGCFRFWRLS